MHRTSRRSITTAAGGAIMVLALAGGGIAAAHTQTVSPGGEGDGFTKPISNPWAMAHCQAAAPLLVAAASGGVVQFAPSRSFDNCVPGTRGEGH